MLMFGTLGKVSAHLRLSSKQAFAGELDDRTCDQQYFPLENPGRKTESARTTNKKAGHKTDIFIGTPGQGERTSVLHARNKFLCVKLDDRTCRSSA